MVEWQSSKTRTRSATACTDREWPCNHCQARKIAHLCKFASRRTVRAAKSRSRETIQSECFQTPGTYLTAEPVSHIKHDIRNDDDFRVLGYLPDHQNASKAGGESEEGHRLSFNGEMEAALRIIPAKPYADILVEHFLDNTNYQYYALYPPAFMHDYSIWWSRKVNGLPLTADFTCLLIRVCACSVPHIEEGLREKLESELGESLDHLSVRYHNTAKQLSSTIGPGKGGMTQIQQLFLTAQWYKTEALFVESWHALSVAIHEAQEQGMHKNSSSSKFSDFDREMRRRLWCILYAWDWQMSLLLARPIIINSSCCAFEMPTMQLESGDSESEAPSPMAHMVLQCQLGLAISKIPGVMGGELSATQAIPIQEQTEKWFDSFPPVYSILNPSTQWDSKFHFVNLQRLQLHVIGYMMLLMPLKECLTKHFSTHSSSIEKGLQRTAVEDALKLLAACDDLLRHIYPLNAKFHFAPFLMFDTAALLCLAILHDKEESLPRREEIFKAISRTLNDLSRLSKRAKTGMICYTILKKLVACLPTEARSTEPEAPQSSIDVSSTIPDMPGIADAMLCCPTTDLSNSFDSEIFPPKSLNSTSLDTLGGLGDLCNVDLGELGQIWDWQDLDINFPTGPLI
ncbi:fungal-specific transcription factor domain-containing protein [Aspergillus keveii]|uniref:Fungal-specific transcription factor domain-containing protein n=1 Tax=Aspergillus keveii TaxID=714993 RepID=A0ABR4GBP6_9EURO